MLSRKLALRSLFVADRPLIGLLFISILIRMAVAWSPFTWLLSNQLVDDAFYYFKIATNVVNGKGISFDGIGSTNGFHPLYLIIIIPFFAVIHDKILVIHAVLSLAAILDTISVYILYRICVHYLRLHREISLMVATLYSLNTYVWFSGGGSLNGLETAVNVLCILLFIIVYLETVRTERIRCITLGVATGAVLLARTDNIILVVICYIYIIWSSIKRITQVMQLIKSVLIAIIMISPFLIWSLVTFGTIIQVSGISVPAITKTILAAQGWSTQQWVLQFLKNLANITLALGIPVRSKNEPLFVLSITAYGIAGFLWIIGYLKCRTPQLQDRFWATIRLIIPLFIMIPTFVLVHTVRAVYLRGWYYSSLIPIILLGVGVGLNHARSCSKSFMKMFPVVLVLGWLMLFGIGVVRNMIWPLDLETDKFAVLSKVRSVVPRGTRIGSFNAGVFGYFLDDMIVINLDGVVNNAAYPYIAERKLDKYIVLVNIEYLFDGSEAIEILKQYLVDDEHWGRNLQLVFSERGRLTTMELWAVPR